MRKKITLVVVILVIVFALFAVSEGEWEIFEQKPVRVILVGDVMLSRQIGKLINATTSPEYPLGLIKEKIKSADIAFANLENPVSERGANVGSIYSFRAHPNTLSRLAEAGFDVVSVANNHMFDWGKDAFEDTFMHLEEAGILYAGGGKDYASVHTPARLKVRGQEVCFLAYTEFASSYFSNKSSVPAMAGLKEDEVVYDIKEAYSNECESVIVSIHWGVEYQPEPEVWQKELARKFIDAGATMIVGHHPHVIQPVEEYNGGLIIYSLGNFIFDQNFPAYEGRTKVGLMVEVNLAGGKIISHTKTVIKFTPDFQPHVFEGVY